MMYIAESLVGLGTLRTLHVLASPCRVRSYNSRHTATLRSAQMLGFASHFVSPQPLYKITLKPKKRSNKMTNQKTNKCGAVNIEKCDIFDFMANVVGLTVLHPGGFRATNELARLCKINKNAHVLDIVCGKGTSAYYLSKRFGCRVSRIDIEKGLISQARKLATRKKMDAKLTFKVANAENLPFADNEFDVPIFQAVLVLVNDKEKAIKEAIRVTKPYKYIGILELSWQKQPTKEFFEEAIKKICSVCMQNEYGDKKYE